MQAFFGRKDNLEQLDRFYNSPEASLVFIKGRRRVGKSTLIRQFFADKTDVFSIAGFEDENDRTLRRRLARAWDQFTGNRRLALIRAVDLDWISIFDEMRQHIKASDRKVSIVFDEIQWLHSKGNGLVGYIKEFWESLKGHHQLKIVISGSSTRFFNDHVVGQNATLRGLLTQSSINVLPFTLHEVHTYYFPSWSKQEVALVYMMIGGVPYYLERIPYKKEKNFVRAINNGVFLRDSIFLDESDNIIKIELLRKTAAERIKALLRHLGYAGKRISALSRITGETEDYIFKTLALLSDVGLVRNRAASQARKKAKSEDIYFLDDPYLNFYFSVLEPNSLKIKRNTEGLLFNDIVSSNDGYYIPGFSGPAFELMAYNFLEHARESTDFSGPSILRKLRIHNVNYIVASTLIPQESQIDLLVISDQDREVRVIELKWISSRRNLHASFIEQVVAKTLPKSVPNGYLRSNYLFISTDAPASFTKLASDKNVTLLSLDDLWPS